MSKRVDILLPFSNELYYVESQLGEMVKQVRKGLQLGLATGSVVIVVSDHLDPVALDFVLLLLVLALLVVEPLPGHMQVLVDVLDR